MYSFARFLFAILFILHACGLGYETLFNSSVFSNQNETVGSQRRLLYTPNKHFSILLQDSLVSGIHVALTHRETVLIIDRTDTMNTKVRLPGTRNYAYAVEYDLRTRNLRPLDVKTNTFCSNGQFLPDGTLVNIGGHRDRYNANGGYSIRYFKPCNDGKCDFYVGGEMRTRRWYPSTQILPDGRIFIAGGSTSAGAINNILMDNPTYEFWPRRDGERPIRLDLLVSTLPFNLYPFIHLLPSGRLFIFSDSKSIVFDYSKNEVVRRLPDLGPRRVTRQYPLAGTTFMLPLTWRNRYRCEIVVCGGSDRAAFRDISVASTNHCGRIAPESQNPRWEDDYMPMRRVMPDSVILSDGKVLIINGVEYGYGSLDQKDFRNPVYTPVVYDPTRRLGRRWRTVSDASSIARLYHSSAILLPDSRVMLAGSNPNKELSTRGPFPTEFRVEAFTPDYLLTGREQPTILEVSRVRYGQIFTVVGNANSNDWADFTACMIDTGFSTHSVNFGQRHIFLEIRRMTFNRGRFSASILAPPTNRIAPPGYYWLNILVKGIPSKKSFSVQIV